MYNELERVCIGCEAILTSERSELHKAIINFTLDYSPLRTRDQIYVVVADGATNQLTLVDTLYLPNIKYMADQWHLFDNILPKLSWQILLQTDSSNTKRDVFIKF